jgi:hypothetical protein
MPEIKYEVFEQLKIDKKTYCKLSQGSKSLALFTGNCFSHKVDRYFGPTTKLQTKFRVSPNFQKQLIIESGSVPITVTFFLIFWEQSLLNRK